MRKAVLLCNIIIIILPSIYFVSLLTIASFNGSLHLFSLNFETLFTTLFLMVLAIAITYGTLALIIVTFAMIFDSKGKTRKEFATSLTFESSKRILPWAAITPNVILALLSLLGILDLNNLT